MNYGIVDNPYLERSEWNWQIDPLGFRDILNKMYNRYNLPIFPIENSLGVLDEWDGERPFQDDYRIDYLKGHLQGMEDAVELDVVEVVVYLGWGLLGRSSAE